MNISIQPYTVSVPLSETWIATNVDITVNLYDIGVKAAASCKLSDNIGHSYTASVSLTETQFSEWGNNDDWFVDCILKNIGAKRA